MTPAEQRIAYAIRLAAGSIDRIFDDSAPITARDLSSVLKCLADWITKEKQ